MKEAKSTSLNSTIATLDDEAPYQAMLSDNVVITVEKNKKKVQDQTITVKETLRIVAMTGGIMICARVLSAGGGFTANVMLYMSTENLKEKNSILEAGALIGTLQGLTLGVLSVALSVYGNDIGKLFKQITCDSSSSQAKIEIGRLYHQSLIISCCLTIPPSLLFYFASNIFKSIGETQDACNLTQNYFHSFFYGVLPQLLSYNVQTFAISVKQPWHAFSANLIYTASNLAITYGLVTRMNMKYEGMGWAATIANSATFSTLLIYHISNKKFKEYQLYKISSNAIPTSNELKIFL